MVATHSYQTGGKEASCANPCLVCGSDKWCFHMNEDAVVCGNTDHAPDGWIKTGEAKDGRGIFAKEGRRRPPGGLPSPEEILPLALDPKTDSPEWVTLSTVGTESEQQIEYLYTNPETGEPLGKVVRKQWTDRRAVYGRSGRDTKEIRPWHWSEPYHPNQKGQGFWSDRGKGSKPWPLYRQAEARDAIASGLTGVLFYVAGEQAVEELRKLGLTAICNQGGEGSYIQEVFDFVNAIKPKLFVIWGDFDEAGRKLTGKLLKAFTKSVIPTIALKQTNIWENMPEKGDIYDLVTKSGMNTPEIIQRIEEEIRRALSSGNGNGGRGEHDGGDSNNQQSNDPDLVANTTVEAYIFDSLFESGRGRTRTIEDSFYIDTGAGYWKRIPDKRVLKTIGHKLKRAYCIVKEGKQESIKFPYFTDAKKKSTFLICRDTLDIGEIPANNHLRCFLNCTVDLRTGESIPHDSAHFLTTAIAAEYQPNQECPEIFLKFIKSAYGEDLIEIIRAYTSMLLDPTAPYGKFIHLMGSSGSGKGTLLRLWGEMFGNDHFRSGEFSNLSTSEGRHQHLTGAALYAVPDVGGYVQGLKPFYELVDNGPMTGRALFSSNAYQKLWSCRYVVASVDQLQIENSGDGWERRCLPLPTKARTGIEDSTLGTKLAEVKGQIISWALAMPRDERDRLILHPSTNERVLNLKHDAAIHGDPVRAFVDMCLRPASNAQATLESHQLHSWFGAFCQQHGYQGWGMSKFINHLKTILPNHYVSRRRASVSVDANRGIIPAHWSSISDLAEVFVDLADQQTENSNDYYQGKSESREPQWCCIKSKCQEGGLTTFKQLTKSPPSNGSGGSPGSGTPQKVGDPCETTQNQAFQENGSGGSPGSGGEGVKHNAADGNSTRVEKKIGTNSSSHTPLFDLPDPKSENPADASFNADQGLDEGEGDPNDPSDPSESVKLASVRIPQEPASTLVDQLDLDKDLWSDEEPASAHSAIVRNMASVENDAFTPQPFQQPEPVPATRTKQALVFRIGDRCHYSGPEGAMAVTCHRKELEVVDTRLNEQSEQEAEVRAPRWCTTHWILSRHLKKVR